MVFLKGYQWPFDSRKVQGGSSIVDILVYIETVQRGRRAFLDFRENPEGFRFEDLSGEAQDYLTRSEALLETPIARLRKMNPGAIELYADHGIDISTEPLEIAVCAQHNNGGLAGNHWWESANIRHLFPVGEVNGSHGVYRPGGSALNSGQVGSLRAAEFIAHRYTDWTLDRAQVAEAAQKAGGAALAAMSRCRDAARSWQDERLELQARMSRAGAHIRSEALAQDAVAEAWAQFRRLEAEGCAYGAPGELREALQNRQLCFAHVVYLEAILYAIGSGMGSRGSALTLSDSGTDAHPQLGDEWRFAEEDPSFRDRVQETLASPDSRVENAWIARRSIPESDVWFETAWAAYREGEIYRT
jgi:succinate dehydrogenase/fumarate reductase flavoprotein subunit